MAEWLGKGLQNLVQRFESASDLNFKAKDLGSNLLPRSFALSGSDVGPVPGSSERYELVLLRPEADRFAMFERMDAVA